MKLTILQKQLAGIEELVIKGKVLAIDPSSGSQKSQPGYAIYEAGVLIDSGTIQVSHKNQLHSRLYYLAGCIRDQFDVPDILVTENISSVMNSNSGFMSKSMLPLQRAVGVVQSIFPCPCLEVAPATWRKYIPKDYVKSDENDAIMLGWAAIYEAGKNIKQEVIPSIGDRNIGGFQDEVSGDTKKRTGKDREKNNRR